MSGKSKLTIEEILKSDRKKINADEESIHDDKFSLYNKQLFILLALFVKNKFGQVLKKLKKVLIIVVKDVIQNRP